MKINDKDKLTYSRLLGKGTFSKVYKGAINGQGSYAFKIVQRFDTTATELLIKNEIPANDAFSHNNIVEYLGFAKDSEKYYVIFEFMPGGTLQNLILSSPNSLTEDRCFSIAADIAKALDYIFEKGYLHRDIKPQNLLLDADGNVKLADFGFALKMADAIRIQDLQGTANYIAPELIEQSREKNALYTYTTATDIYAFGIVIWQITHKKEPFVEFDKKGIAKLFDFVLNEDGRDTIDINTNKKFASIIENCWARNVAQRPSTKTILELLSNRSQIDEAIADQNIGVQSFCPDVVEPAIKLSSYAGRFNNISAEESCANMITHNVEYNKNYSQQDSYSVNCSVS